uniref:Leucine-rich repeat-containing N-terminal plant-type domain-containing protein n=1 Tax=Salix viminalis TaxID=40686 RepID=A0A6N2NHZ4_SALVM
MEECKTLENGDEDSMLGVTKTILCIFLRERDRGSHSLPLQENTERGRKKRIYFISHRILLGYNLAEGIGVDSSTVHACKNTSDQRDYDKHLLDQGGEILSSMESTKGSQPCPLLLFMLLFLFLNSRTMQAENQELELLLSFKSSLNDPSKYLSNWNTSATFCNWLGITCTNSSHISVIQLSGKNMSGKISSLIFHLPYIETVDLSSNQLSGKLPDDIFFSSSLRYLNLSNNNFTGPIPSGSVPLLETLDLSNNMLSGKIPEEIGSFWSLKFLDLGGNVLAGEIPPSIAKLKRLQVFTLASNRLVGQIPRELGQMGSLKLIYLGYNNLSGEIPTEIGQLISLNHLNLVYNNLIGQIPTSLGNLTDLHYLVRSRMILEEHNNLTVLDLSTNSLAGRIPEGLCSSGNLFKLILFSNSLEGEIPKSLSACKSLQRIRLQENGLSGELPSEFTKLPLVYFLGHLC